MDRPWEVTGTRKLSDIERRFMDRWGEVFVDLPQPAEPPTFRQLCEVMEELPEPPPARQFRCGNLAWAVLRSRSPDCPAPPELGAVPGGAGLYGIPVYVDQNMRPGRWELREGDRVVHEGDMAPGL